MSRSIQGLLGSTSGAVAPTVALALFALIAAGGIAFDYSRMASMDTELQDAADQAALAAAGQLDGQDGACERAVAAAQGLLTNRTLMANESGGTRDITIADPDVCDDDTGITFDAGASIRFYKSYDRDADTPGDPSDDDSNAKVVIVSVNPREAFFTLTPVVAALRSGQIGAQAVAALGSAVCKMPPVMICNPSETPSNTSFNAADYIGDGMRLTSVGNGSGSWVPGNFGYLDTDITEVSGAVNQLRAALGWNNPPGECIVSDGVDTKPGATVTVTDAMNTRFDIFQNGNNSCINGGPCSASVNSVKDLKRPANASNAGNGCKIHNQGWQLPSGYYGDSLPTTAALELPAATIPSAMGHPRDECHATSAAGSCTNGRIGNGVWDANAYFRTNYVRTVATANGAVGTRWTSGTGAGSWQNNTGLSPTVARVITGTTTPNPAYASRYNVYLWEIAHKNVAVDGVTVLGSTPAAPSGNTLTAYRQPQCTSAQTPSSTVIDRRRISVAVVNCAENNVRGNREGVPVEKWIDVFLVEPSLNRNRTNDGDMYVEIIGEAVPGGSGSTAGQVIRHDAPYLIR